MYSLRSGSNRSGRRPCRPRNRRSAHPVRRAPCRCRSSVPAAGSARRLRRLRRHCLPGHFRCPQVPGRFRRRSLPGHFRCPQVPGHSRRPRKPGCFRRRSPPGHFRCPQVPGPPEDSPRLPVPVWALPCFPALQRVPPRLRRLRSALSAQSGRVPCRRLRTLRRRPRGTG